MKNSIYGKILITIIAITLLLEIFSTSGIAQRGSVVLPEKQPSSSSEFEQKRIIVLTGTINDDVANEIINRLFYLDSVDSRKDIYLYIDSPGGSFLAGLAIYEIMQELKSDVVTVNVSLAASTASFLLAAGTKGKRFSLHQARVMIHQPYANPKIRITELEMREVSRITKLCNEILARNTGQSVAQIETDTKTDFWMSADEAKRYGMIDFVIDDVAQIQSFLKIKTK
jgi:ATP-dependent Clp protease protease subunit